MQKTLDLAIKHYEKGAGGYLANNGKTYDNYLSNKSDNNEWKAFKEDMKNNYPSAYEQYGKGSGGEMKEGKNYPPKMASYGSSSRMIFNLCKHLCKSGFQFEYKLPTYVGGTANLDGFMQKNDRYIFVEAKCREPYGEKSHMIDDEYEGIFDFINTSKCNLGMDYRKEGKKIETAFYVGDIEIWSYDIKQMICHLLGIAVKFLNNPTDKKISFLYLCYNPTLIEIGKKKKRDVIVNVYGDMCKECHIINHKELFRTIMLYLYEEIKDNKATLDDINRMADNFEFTLCDQSNFLSLLN